MKKLACLIMVLVIFVGSVACASGINVTHVPIKMLDLEFGCSLEEAQKQLKDKHGIKTEIWSESDYSTIDPPKSVICEEGTSYDYENHKRIGVQLASYVPECDVAGYPLENVVLQFLYPCDDNYIMQHDENAARLISAVYTFKSENSDEMFDDLARKLKSVYGEDTGLTSDQIYSFFSDDSVIYSSREGKTRYMLWESDANDSWLVLKSTNSDGLLYQFDIIQIMYVSRWGNSWISKNIEARKREKIAAEAALYGNNDTSGL